MPQDLKIKTEGEQLKLTDRRGTMNFKVVNQSRQTMKVLARPEPVETAAPPEGKSAPGGGDRQTKPEWLKVVGDDKKDLAPDADCDFTVEVTLPPPPDPNAGDGKKDVDPGTYRFALKAFSFDDPNEHWGKSADISFVVPPPKKKKVCIPCIVIPIVVVLLLGGGIAAWLLTKGVVVPDLIGSRGDDVKAILADKHLKMKEPLAFQEVADKEPGTVTAQKPTAGTKVKEDSEVEVTVAKLPLIEIPQNLAGQPRDDVLKALRDLKLINISEAEEKTTTQPPGKVVRTEPSGGAKVTPDQKVTVIVAVTSLIEIPREVVGLDRIAAVKLLLDRKLTNLSDASEKTAAQPAGKVTRTDPPVGTQVGPDKHVTIVVAEKPDPPDPVNAFLGRWVNDDKTNLIAEINIRTEGNKVLVQTFGREGIKSVLWGQVPGTMPTAASPTIEVKYLRQFVQDLRLSVVNRQLHVDGVTEGSGIFRTRKFTANLRPFLEIKIIDTIRFRELHR
jgi:beta-lactam-binding protein with PASTA domain